MKTSTLRKTFLLLLAISAGFSPAWAVTHGSLKATAVPFYAQGSAGGNISTPVNTATLDYKLVTKGTKTWAYLKFNGTSAIDIGAAWTSQLRYWSSSNAKTENNLTVRRNATTKEVWGTATSTIPNPLNVSIFQALNPGGYSETLLSAYDVTAKNSPTAGDVTAPVVNSCTVNASETEAALTLNGSDDSGDLFYYITDAAHNIEEFAFTSDPIITGLTSSTTYNLTITPIDFTGNEGTPYNTSFTTAGLVQINYGVAQDLRFMLKSTGTQLEYYYEFTNPTKKFRDAFLQITPAGGTMFEIKPTLSADSTYAYGVTTDSRIANKILSLNCGYFIYEPGAPNYANYVMTNSNVTSGVLAGNPIKHQMGGGINSSLSEATNPTLTSATLVDVTPTSAVLNITGSDNSGYVYYEISGAKQTVNAFHTGTYYLTAIDPGHLYNINVVAKDFSGNYTSALPVQVKTMPARSNINDNTGCAYNSTAATSNPELVSVIQQSGNTLTLGCTTSSTLIAAGTWRDRVFNTPTVKVNGTSYPLTLDGNATTATVTFTNTVGSTTIQAGTALQVQWSVYWGATGGGNFFTGTYTYVIGDNGQTDISGPSTPSLSLNGNTLSWPACTDDLSGVKYYVVTESGQSPVTVFDLNQTSFTYTMANASNLVSVKAVDFVNNNSALASMNDTPTAVDAQRNSSIALYPNPATDKIYINNQVQSVGFYTLQGQLTKTVNNQQTIDISTLAKGLYFVRITDRQGKTSTTKLEVR